MNTAFSRYRTPPCTSFVDLEEVPAPKSSFSTSAAVRPLQSTEHQRTLQRTGSRPQQQNPAQQAWDIEPAVQLMKTTGRRLQDCLCRAAKTPFFTGARPRHNGVWSVLTRHQRPCHTASLSIVTSQMHAISACINLAKEACRDVQGWRCLCAAGAPAFPFAVVAHLIVWLAHICHTITSLRTTISSPVRSRGRMNDSQTPSPHGFKE